MDFSVLLQADTLEQYYQGVLTTLKLLAISLAFGLAFSVPLSLLRSAKAPWMRGPVWLFSYIWRGTPLLVQLYLIYYGIAQFPWIQARWDQIWPWTLFKEPLFCTLLAFALNTTAYTTELFAGAIRDTPPGEVEAGLSLGMSRSALYRRIVLPSALRRALPGYGNEIILMLQATSVASVVPSIVDITGAASTVYSTYYLPFEAYLAAGLIYLCLTFALVHLLRVAERRWLAYLDPVRH